MIDVETVSIDIENHANNEILVQVYCADMADHMVTALGRYTSVRREQTLSWWFHDSGSVECYQCVSGTVADLFDWLAHVLMMADKWGANAYENSDSDASLYSAGPMNLAGDYREMSRLIGDALLRHWLADTVVSADMGLNAEWSVSAFLVEPDATLAGLATQWQQCGAAYVIDAETDSPCTWEIVRRWAPDESGRANINGLPFAQEVYEHADKHGGHIDDWGNDYIGMEGATMSAPAAYVEISRRMGIVERS